jgi:hypothetical protein
MKNVSVLAKSLLSLSYDLSPVFSTSGQGGSMDRKLEVALTLLYITKQSIIEATGFNLQALYNSVCAATHPRLRILPEYVLAEAKAEDPEIEVEIDDDMNKIMDTIAEIVCQETKQLTLNLVTKTLINDPDLELVKCKLQLLKLQSRK